MSVTASDEAARRVPVARAGFPILVILRVLLAAAAVFAAVGAATSPWFRNADGALDARVCLAFSVGIGLGVGAVTLGTRLAAFGFWAAAALAGQALTLQLIDAGTAMHYQHYRPLAWFGSHPALAAALVAYVGVVGAGGASYVRPALGWIRRHARLPAILGVMAVMVLPAAVPSPRVADWLFEFALAVTLQAVNLAAVLLAAWSLPAERLSSLAHSAGHGLGLTGDGPQASRRARRVVLVAAAWVTAVGAMLAYFVYDGHPHIPDEVAYLFHARYLAEGRLSVPAPPVPEAFELYLFETAGGRLIAVPPPGWPAVLAAGVRLGVPWLVNPVLGGLAVILSAFVLEGLFSRRVAVIGALLLATSPWHLFMAMNFMTHMVTLVLGLAAAAAVIAWRRTGRVLWPALAGLAIGAGSVVRPLDGLVVGALAGLLGLGVAWHRLRLSAVVALAACAALAASPTILYNAALTGHWSTFPINAYADRLFGPGVNDLGFGARGVAFGGLVAFPGHHGPLNALVNAALNAFSLNIELFGWGGGSLLLATLALLSRRRTARDLAMLGALVVVAAAYSLYWFSGGPDFGARYWYLMLLPLVALTVRGAVAVAERLAETTRPETAAPLRVAGAVVLCSTLALVNYLPWRAIDKYHHYLNMRPDVREMAGKYWSGASVVIVRGDEHPDYASAFVYNPLDLNAAQPVYVRGARPDAVRRVLEAMSDRPVWVVDGPSRTGRGYEVVRGPLSATAVSQSGWGN